MDRTETLAENPQNPLVSIVMCTYNGSAYLQEQMESLLQQDYRPLEIVVVDDVSKDNTWELLEQWKAAHPDIFRIYQNESNLGYNKNFEKAIQLAKGEYISISDQDDIWMPTKTSKSVAALEAVPDSMLAHCKSVAMEKGILKMKHLDLKTFFEGTDTRQLFLHSQFAGHAMMFKKELLPFLLPFPGHLIYDWWIAVNACSIGRIVLVNELLVHHRVHTKNASKTMTVQIDIDQVLAIFLKIEHLQADHRVFLEKLYSLIERHIRTYNGKTDWALFNFLFAHRHIIYGHKKRKFPNWSYAKRAFLLARKDLKGWGWDI